MKRITIVISNGFHNSPDLKMRVRVKGDIHPATDTLREVLSESQIIRANRHFCGIKGCTCGGIQRTTYQVST